MTRSSIVLAGGLSSRMGSPKPALQREGVTLLQDVVSSCPEGDVVVVGPNSLGSLLTRGARIVREDPPGGGPLAGLAAGVAALGDEVDVVQVLACDLSHAREIVAALDESDWPVESDLLVPVDGAGWPQYLAGRYRVDGLRAALPDNPRDRSVNRVLCGLNRTEVRLSDAVLADMDTPEAAARHGWELGDSG